MSTGRSHSATNKAAIQTSPALHLSKVTFTTTAAWSGSPGSRGGSVQLWCRPKQVDWKQLAVRLRCESQTDHRQEVDQKNQTLVKDAELASCLGDRYRLIHVRQNMSCSHWAPSRKTSVLLLLVHCLRVCSGGRTRLYSEGR